MACTRVESSKIVPYGLGCSRELYLCGQEEEWGDSAEASIFCLFPNIKDFREWPNKQLCSKRRRERSAAIQSLMGARLLDTLQMRDIGMINRPAEGLFKGDQVVDGSDADSSAGDVE